MIAAVASVAMLFTGCSRDDSDEGKTTPTAKETASATPTGEPATPAAGTPSGAEPTPGAKNLMYFALEEDSLEPPAGNQWGPVASDRWTGPCWDRRIEEVEIDGEYVDCLYVTHTVTDENGSNIGNVFGVGDIIEPNKTYQFTVTFKYTDPTAKTDPGHRELMYITCNAARENVLATDNLKSGIKFSASDDWQTIEYTFTTGDKFPEYKEGDNHAQEPYIMVGPSCDYQRFYGEVSDGIELWISAVSLVEVTQ